MIKQRLIDNIIIYSLLALMLCFVIEAFKNTETIIGMLSFTNAILCFIGIFIINIKIKLDALQKGDEQ